MRKFLSVFLPIFIMLAVAGICIGIYMIFTNSLPQFVKNSNGQIGDTAQKNDAKSVVLLKEELPRIETTGLTKLLCMELVKNFTQNDDISESDISIVSSDDGFNDLLNDKVDVLFSTYPSESVLELAKSKDVELDIIPIAQDGFVFFVSVDNPVDGLKVSEIQKIYNGQITNWSQVGGNNQIIKAFQRPNHSPTQNEMINSVMKNLQIIDAPKDVFHDKQFGDIEDVIATYDNAENSLGYSYLFETKILYDINSKIDNTIKLLKINDVEPNYETIKNGTYPIRTNYYLIKNKANTSETLEIFTQAVCSDRGKNVIKEAGYIDN